MEFPEKIGYQKMCSQENSALKLEYNKRSCEEKLEIDRSYEKGLPRKIKYLTRLRVFFNK